MRWRAINAYQLTWSPLLGPISVSFTSASALMKHIRLNLVAPDLVGQGARGTAHMREHVAGRRREVRPEIGYGRVQRTGVVHAHRLWVARLAPPSRLEAPAASRR